LGNSFAQLFEAKGILRFRWSTVGAPNASPYPIKNGA
jgi:hypothetical protein